ncbi:type VI secretion system-associated FHA domain protein TagH [Bosea sp. BK604]|uniref:type VI secretion system-associated FHA domain protein TagH n=1 Tax=Bosea sp. BK604 TaxID=2512180 RepID=UPI0010494941|nr:type VI secretion system-associated FHA domain protein TagH [Bosea sp. BK604]TCR64160.1 FHA domain protein [Bosea sp. BK604]
MRLLLTVLSAQRSNLGERSTHAFDMGGGIIGRNSGCEWSLPDASNTLSSRHATISHNGHGFVVTDTSTNGVYLNSVDTPIGRGQSAPLSNGDTLYISDYIISVALLRDQPQQASPLHMAPPAPAPFLSASPLPGTVSPTFSALPTSIGTMPAAAPSRPSVDRIGLSMEDLLGPAPTPATQSPAATVALPSFPAAPAAPPVQLPPLAPAAVAPPSPPPAAVIPDDFDFSDLMPGGVPATAPLAPPPPPPAAATLTSLNAPRPVPQAPPGPPAAIPANFSLMGEVAAPAPVATAPEPTGFALPNLPPQPAPPFPASPPVAMPAPVPAPEAALAPALDPLAMLRHRAIARAASIDLSRPNGEAAPRMPEPAPAAAPRPAIGAVAMPGGMAADAGSDAEVFWQALGLDADAIPAASRQDMLAELGRAMRETASGLVAILSARKSLKDEFRIDQTRLAALENNPFKFFRSGDDALRRVIVEGKPGYLPLDRAVKQGFSDIQAHEVATVVAMQSALRKLLARMAPVAIESGTEPGLLGRRPDKGKLWDRYVEAHGGLSSDLDRTTREMLAEEFARAYAEQTKGDAAETGR